MKRLQTIILLFLLMACRQSFEEMIVESPQLNKDLDDSEFIMDASFEKGDVRRYGVYPDSVIAGGRVNNILELVQKGLPLYFPPGYYPINLTLEGVNNAELTFDKALIGGALNITESGEKESSQIAIKGSLTVLDKVFIRKSKHISFDDLFIVTDTLRNIYGQSNRGLSIYVGTRNVRVKKLRVLNTGGDEKDHFKYTAAAVQIHGWNNNPKYIVIDELFIENANRSAAYITGTRIRINNMFIQGFGSGSNLNMAGLDDAPSGSEKSFAGLWLNKCNDCYIGDVSIANKAARVYSLRLGPGEAYQPTIIDRLNWKNDSASTIEDDLLTNVIIKSVATHE